MVNIHVPHTKTKNMSTKKKKNKLPEPCRTTSGPCAVDLPINLGKMTLEDFKLFSPAALRGFLTLRKKSLHDCSSTIDSSCAFISWEEQIPTDPDNEHSYRKALAEYKTKLVIKGKVMPDPLGLTDGWLDESQGMKHWPSLYFEDMAGYLRMKTPQELCHRLLNEYKEGKAYRYFVSGWVREVMFHPIHADSKYCFLWCRVCPSFKRTSSKDYQVWALVVKDKDGVPGGEIINAYCTCTAGLLGCCNHVAGLLFRVEAAVRTGITKPSCTSERCKWNLPSQKLDVLSEPVLVSDVQWQKGHYMQQDSIREGHCAKKLFSPMSKSQQNHIQQVQIVRKELAEILRPNIPNSSFIQLMDKKRTEPPKDEHFLLPPSPMDLAVDNGQDLANYSLEEAVDMYLKKMELTADDRAAIERATRQQAELKEWHEQRKGRITASKVKNIFTRMATLTQKGGDERAIVQSVMAYSSQPTTAAMKHGKAQEMHAKRLYGRLSRRCHRQFHTKDSGLVIDENHPFIGASPDLCVQCSCHGEGLCEIKCPYSIRDATPSETNLPYLCMNNGEVKLIQTSEYYYQVQCQMAVCKVNYCDFFVYTSHGHHLERIFYDSEMWQPVLERLISFWKKYVFPELLTQNIWNESGYVHSVNQVKPVEMMAHDHNYVSSTSVQQKTTKKDYVPKAASNMPVVYLCGSCKEDALSLAVECCQCNVWFHFACVGLKEPNIPERDDVWLCEDCESP